MPLLESNAFLSVIIPTYNRATFLPEALASILGNNVSEQQAYQPLEIIVVDDGSTDNTREIANSFKGDIRYLYQSNRGPAAARNAGIKMACGNVLAFLDSDDLWVEGGLAWRMARLTASSEQEPEVDIVLGLTQRVNLMRTADGGSVFQALIPPWAATHFGSAVFKKSVFDKIGLLDESLPCGEDLDWFLRAREQNVHMAFIKSVTQLYRIHDSNLTNDTSARDLFFLKALKKSLDRRRQSGKGSITEIAPIADLDEIARHLRRRRQ